MMDVIVIGGGAAGLSAALVLGRSRRRTLVVDAGEPRNAPSPSAHSIFTRDGTPPAELLRIARAQLEPYPSVELRDGSVEAVRRSADGFSVLLADGTELSARRVLFAIGVRDDLPPIDGVARLWGRGVLHCPYCHGWEVRDEPLALCASGKDALEFTPLLLQWSNDLLLCTNGSEALGADERATLTGLGVRIIESPIARVEGVDTLERIVFDDGHEEPRRALFVRPPQTLVSDLPRQLGCELTDAGLIQVGADNQTSVPGVYAAGDAASAAQQIVVAAASGAQAAIRINHDLVQASVFATHSSSATA
jgi:thioredoxin reductase